MISFGWNYIKMLHFPVFECLLSLINDVIFYKGLDHMLILNPITSNWKKNIFLITMRKWHLLRYDYPHYLIFIATIKISRLPLLCSTFTNMQTGRLESRKRLYIGQSIYIEICYFAIWPVIWELTDFGL